MLAQNMEGQMEFLNVLAAAIGAFAFGAVWYTTLSKRWIAAAEQASEHPSAQALVRAAEAQQLSLPAAEQFEARAGYGVTIRSAWRCDPPLLSPFF